MATVDQVPPALRVSGLVKRFGDVVAVDGVSFDVQPGEVVGLLGPNGAGKTTTIRMLCGLLKPDQGQIELGGFILDPTHPAAVRAIGVAPQANVVWESLTCEEQLTFVGQMYGMTRSAARERTTVLLRVFGLSDKARCLGRTLSGGMQRRLNLSLALIHDPALVFLDEPQAGLDPQSRILVRDYIASQAGHVTFVVTTHDMEEAEKLADRVCIMDRGRLLVSDTVNRVISLLGEGDVVEMRFDDVPNVNLMLAAQELREHIPGLASGDGSLHFVAADAAAAIAAVIGWTRGLGWKLSGLQTRSRTLEDVFIRLTGRGLRE